MFLSVFLAPLELFSYYLDGPYNTYPYWYHCMSGEKVLSLIRPIYVKKTLLIDFETAQEYDKAVPLIYGDYQQLVLHSKYHWTHIEQLMHAGVKQLQLNGSSFANGFYEIRDDEYGEIVPFMLNRAKDPEFKLVFLLFLLYFTTCTFQSGFIQM
uniref:Methyltransf_21 domain-containing protein n=1 Tax=Panagrellus redivivus TaxID=6233 RepID=A0A7E4VPC6_PANRE